MAEAFQQLVNVPCEATGEKKTLDIGALQDRLEGPQLVLSCHALWSVKHSINIAFHINLQRNYKPRPKSRVFAVLPICSVEICAKEPARHAHLQHLKRP